MNRPIILRESVLLPVRMSRGLRGRSGTLPQYVLVGKWFGGHVRAKKKVEQVFRSGSQHS